MESVAQPPPGDELRLLTDWGEASGRPRRRGAGIVSIALHGLAILALAVMPAGLLETPRVPVENRVTPLVEPLTELTQPEPNKGRINREFNVAESAPRPRLQMPSGVPAPAAGRGRPMPPVPMPPLVAPKQVPAALPEPPKLDAGAAPKQELALPQVAQIQEVERPKIVLEDPMAPRLPAPGKALPPPRALDAIRAASRGQDAGQGGYGFSVNLPASPGMQPNNMQLLSDPMGVDFRPYLTQVLAAVKRYWMAVWPESARMGRSGKVAIQFSIDRTGRVPKLVIASTSGVDSLDRAAVAAISGSIPFQPLPTDFRGDVIKLQLNFAYNLPKQP